jgi:hypothetical protein
MLGLHALKGISSAPSDGHPPRVDEKSPAISRALSARWDWSGAQDDSDSSGLAGLAEPLELFTATTLAGLLVISLATHLLPKAAALAQLAEASDGFLDRLAGTDP